MRVHEAIVEALGDIGVDAAFGGAGENAAGLMLALDASKRIRPIIAKNEQAAAFMACGYAMFTGRLGVCFATAGPGAFNLISGLCVALTDSYPVLAISGYSTVAWEGRGGLNETSGRGRTPNSHMMFDACCKTDPATGKPANFLVTDPAKLVDTLERAVRIAFEGRPGPVHIAIAEDITPRSVEVPNFRRIDVRPAPVAPDPAQLEAAGNLLEDALNRGDRVCVLAGFGAVRSGAGEALRRFIERFELPLLTTMDGKGIVDEQHRLAIGIFCDSGHKAARDIWEESELVLAIGNSFAQHATFDFDDGLFDGRQLIHINIDPGEIDKIYRADAAIVADAKLALTALHERLDASVGHRPEIDYRPKDYDERFVIGVHKGLHPGRMVQAISRNLPPRGVVLADAGAHAAWCGYYLEMREGQNFRKPGTYGPMGIGVCGALGAKFADPSRPVVAAVGDGCYLMMGFELMTAVTHNIPVVWVIFNDGEFKLIKLYQLSAFFDTALTEFETPDWVAYAHACGAEGFRVEDEEDFEEAFRRAIASGRPTLIDARITRLALPHYSPDPEGILAAIWHGIRERIGV
ncbi:thiamine pyrophosphate-binding protein [Salipiger sp. H15]|uniref:Thiamine pyrophosphate-binding protein n=2 Tax=Alloyangia sp. H15 TaxID=3029062 RepID=A0AAU8ADI7_9RHOB